MLSIAAVNYLLYYQKTLVSEYHRTPREAHWTVVQMANEVFDLNGAVPNGDFSDAQCVFWSLLTRTERTSGMHLNTNPG